jgi:DHA1 family tetracycline resistance protein-like MFS transporter
MNLGFNRQPRLFFIIVTSFINSIGYGLVAPVLPRLVETLGKGGSSQAGYYYTLLITTFAVTQFLFAPTMGRLSDHFGRRPLLLLAITGLGIQYVIAATAQSVVWLFVAEVIAGASGGSIVAVGAYVADISPPEKRARSFGTIWGVAAVGRMVGPLAGGMLSNGSYRVAFWAAGALTALNFLHSLLLVPESLPEGPRPPLTAKAFNPFEFMGPLRHVHVPVGLLAGFMLSIVAVSAAAPVLILFMQVRLGWDVKGVGLYMTLTALATVLGQIVLTRLLTPVMSDKRSLFLALAARSLGWILTAFVAVNWHMYALLIFAVLGSVVQPLMGSFISRAVGAAAQGELQGVMTRLGVVAEAIGPILGGVVFRLSTGPSSPINMPGITFVLCALLGIATLLSIKSALTSEHEPGTSLSAPAS